MKLTAVCGIATAICTVAAACTAFAQGGYPNHPAQIVVPFPPGGNTDILARTLANALSETWKQQLVVDNRGGAAGSIGTEIVARSQPDGYTILLGTIGSIGINPVLYRKLPYQPLRDLAPITLMSSNPLVVMVHPSVPAKSLQELIALAKAKPDLLTYGSGGSGTSTHLSVELFKSMAGIQATHVPYRGAALASPALLAGEVSMLFDNLAPALPHIRAGRVRALAVTSAQRSPVLPELPTVQESGLPGYEVTGWYGVLAPAGTPPAILAKIHRDVVAALKTPQVANRLRSDGAQAVGSSPAEFVSFIKAESAKWGGVIKRLGIKAD
jgi:tripartite-type tricarboxylate transporter receptor subunit TctC